MKKGRHRRFEEARALKRSNEVDLNEIFEEINPVEGEHKPEHDAWADLAEEWETKQEAAAENVDELDDEDGEDSDADESATSESEAAS